MSDDDLDLGAYEQAVIEQALWGRARARIAEEMFGERAWDADLAAGTLTIDGVAHEVQILGTFSESARTFLWAWANPGADSWGASLRIVTRLHALAEKEGNAVFGERSVAADWVDPIELAHVCGELGGGAPLFVGPYSGGAALMLMPKVDIDVAKISSAYIPGVILGFAATAMSDPRPAVLRFFERLGFTVQDAEKSLVAARGRERFELKLDRQGRITEVNAHI